MTNRPYSQRLHFVPRCIRLTVSTLFVYVFLCSFVFAATPALNTNLLVNPGAESGTTSGWTCPERQWVAAAEITPHGGSKFFWPGNGDVADTSMYQDVDVSGLSSSIASGTFYMHLSGWLANWDQYPHDRATLALYALDSSGNTLAFYSAAHRSPVWTQYRIDQSIPPGTATLRVVLRATRFVGTDDDGYFDDLSLMVNSAPGATVNLTSQSGLSYETIGSTLKLNATTTGGTDSGYVWSSSFQAIASVDQTGLVSGIAAGRATIQARGTDSGAIGAFDVTVIPANGLVFIEPAANKILSGGTVFPVTWGVVGTVSSAVLNLSLDGGVNYTTFISNIANPSSGVYNWSVPAVTSDVRNASLKLTYSGGESVSSLFSIVTYVNGVCGNSNGATFAVAPAANLCSTGAASTVTGSGPWNWTCSGTNGGTAANCSAKSGAVSIPGSTKARVYLGTDDNFIISNSGTTLYGSSGIDTVTVAAGISGVTLDQNVERIIFSGASGSYTFKQTGNKINIYDSTGTTLLVNVPVQSSGTQLTFSNGTSTAVLSAGVMTLGGATVSSTLAGALTPVTTPNSPSPSTTTKARVYLGTDDIFTVSSTGTTLYGGPGNDIVTIAAGISGVTLDQNVERINLSGTANSYTFKQTGNKINVYDTTATTLLVNVPVQSGGTLLAFSNGTAAALLSGGVMTLGGAAVSSTVASALIPTLN